MSEAGEKTVSMSEWEIWIGSCITLDKNGKCAVGEKHKCSPNNMSCPFHKTKEQEDESLESWKERMNSFSEEVQQFYADLYYGGTMPWRESEIDEVFANLR